MEISLRRKLSLSYILVVLICVFLISFLSNFFLERQFNNYVIQTRKDKNKDIVSSLENHYNSEGKWNYKVVESIGIDALENGLIISVKDLSGKIIWDATIYNHGQCENLITHMSKNMTKRYPNWQGGYTENQYFITYNLNKIGVVDIGYYGPFYYDDNDLIFLNTLNNIFISVGIISLCLSLILGIIIAEGLSRSISRVMNTAENISKGNYKERSSEKSNIKEINRLIATINNLAHNLEEHEKLQKRLTADVSHELRTPLTTLQGHMEAIIDGVWEPTIERVQSCYEEILRIKRLVGDLEKLSKYESENLVLNKANFDISELIKNILMNFENEYVNKNIEVVFKSYKQVIFADRDKITQMIINLISNALKYTQSGGKVILTINDLKEYIEINVKDNGIGISKENLPYIFERFYRTEKSRNRETGGSGIGLTITKTIVSAHNGGITVESKLNEGTVFKISLPKYDN
ncbi:HAMP domain-containing histidine kinase [Lutibacter sp. B2]|nr:HAMP domain-containing histidine kinase [Lutibacter sp. B2]